MEELARVLKCIVHEKRFSKGIVGRAIQCKGHFFFAKLTSIRDKSFLHQLSNFRPPPASPKI
ncbi:hypothetical protein, partial [Bellilinea sp.]|uniref:hypothetical protein n=1 Tax=Bellilinea sp. TaxID=2838785 RepID=UPI002ADE8E62